MQAKIYAMSEIFQVVLPRKEQSLAVATCLSISRFILVVVVPVIILVLIVVVVYGLLLLLLLVVNA